MFKQELGLGGPKGEGNETVTTIKWATSGLLEFTGFKQPHIYKGN